MIGTFGSKETEQIWKGERVKGRSTELLNMARRKLRMLHAAHNTKDLMIPPSNRLEKLKGELDGFYSIRVNDQWRIVFRWDGGNATEVDLMDYH